MFLLSTRYWKCQLSGFIELKKLEKEISLKFLNNFMYKVYDFDIDLEICSENKF